MPIYDFVCKSCSKKFEELVFSDDLPVCIHCQSGDTERLVSCPSRSTCSARLSCSSSAAAMGGDMYGSAGSSRSGCSGCAGSSCASCGH